MARSEMRPRAWLLKCVSRYAKRMSPHHRRRGRTHARPGRFAVIEARRLLARAATRRLVEEIEEHAVEFLGLLRVRQVRGRAKNGELRARKRRVDLARHGHRRAGV